MKASRALTLLAAVFLFGATASFADEGRDESGGGKRDRANEKQWKDGERRGRGEESDRHRGGEGDYFRRHGYTRLNIPKGHLPPPGECRVWYPDRPAGQQPPPTKCGQVPPGAWAVTHPREHPGKIHVTVYEPSRPSLKIVGEFDLGSGNYMRVVLRK